MNGVTKTLYLDDDSSGILSYALFSVLRADHKATWNINDLPAGKYPAFAVYNGNDNYERANASDEFNVKPIKPTINAVADDINAGDTAKIEVSLPADSTGTVSVEIDGKMYTAPVKDGKAIVHIPNLTAGNKVAKISYSGDNNYLPTKCTTKFKVNKILPTLDVISEVINGKDAKITVTVPKDATGTITIDVEGKTYTSPIKNGKATFNIPDLTAGSHDIKVYYPGDAKYLPAKTSTDVEINKILPTLDVISEVINGKDVKITVTVPKDATGTITIDVEGKTYTSPIKNGKATFNIPDLTAGSHDIKVYYSGDDKYLPNNATSTIKVLPVENNNETPQNDEIKHVKTGLGVYETGNPVVVLLLVLIAFGFSPLRRFKK